jgi:hypothetical protein
MEFVKKIRSSRTKNSELKGLWESAGVSKNSKLQISNNKQITMTKIQNSKPVLVIETGDPPAGWGVRRTNIGIWNLFVIWCLGFGIYQCGF